MEPEPETQTLRHCEDVHIFGPTLPCNVVLTLTVGGTPGGGSVQVISPGAPPVDVPTGAPGEVAVPLPQCTDIILHYYKLKGGPDEVDVTWHV